MFHRLDGLRQWLYGIMQVKVGSRPGMPRLPHEVLDTNDDPEVAEAHYREYRAWQEALEQSRREGADSDGEATGSEAGDWSD